MTNLNKSSTLFSCRVRDKVLKNRIEYNLRYNLFEEIEEFVCTSLYDFFKARYSAWEKTRGRRYDETRRNYELCLKLLGPKDYPWKGETECHFLVEYGLYPYDQTIFVFPLNWLYCYDHKTPIFGLGCGPYALDFSKGSCYWYESLLIRDVFYDFDGYSSTVHKSPEFYSDRICDKDWCITYLNFPLPRELELAWITFYSILLFKSIDFSTLDSDIKSGKNKCPVFNDASIKIKDKPQFMILDKFYPDKDGNYKCICVNCRKDYRAVEVKIVWNGKNVGLKAFRVLFKKK